MSQGCREDLCNTCVLRDWCNNDQFQKQNFVNLADRMKQFGFSVN